MPNQKNEGLSSLTLSIILPDAPPLTCECDAVRLTVHDDIDGHGGGAYGIHPGHADALLLLDEGEIRAFRQGKTVFCGRCASGFARVTSRQVTVVTEQMVTLS